MEDRKLPFHFQDFISFMEHKDYAPYRIKNAITIIRMFYNHFNVQLPKTPYKGEPSNYYINIEDLPGFDDIQKAIILSNIKFKAIISLLASSGMSSKDVLSLTVNDFMKAISECYKPTKTVKNSPLHIPKRDEVGDACMATWKMVRQKTGVPFVTFSTPETTHFILDYLHKYPPESLDEPLFRSIRNPRLPTTYKSLHTHFMKLNHKASWEKVGNNYYFTSRMLRKFFILMSLKNSKFPIGTSES
ncbi:MAG: hypothetical protein ACXVHT_07965 [Methanobacterium sp.]